MESASATPFVWHVEDNDGDAYLVVKALSNCGRSIRIGRAIDGRDALDTLQSIQEGRQEAPALVILDLKLPFISGLDLLKYMRDKAPLAQIPVVVFTSSDEAKDIETAHAAGCDDYYVKPIDYTVFRASIKEICDKYLGGEGDRPSDKSSNIPELSLAS